MQQCRVRSKMIPILGLPRLGFFSVGDSLTFHTWEETTMATSKTLERRDTLYKTLTLVIAILALTLSSITFIKNEYRYSSLADTIGVLEKTSKDYAVCLESLKTKSHHGMFVIKHEEMPAFLRKKEKF